MTGLKKAEKSDAHNVTAPEDNKPSRGERKRSLLIGVVASLATALVLGSVFVGVIFYLQEKNANEKPEWISWVRKSGAVDIHESVLIDEKEKTILMVSAEAYRIHEQNSMSLHDFELGYVALRDIKQNICLVTKVQNPDFEAVKQMLESRQGKQLDLQPLEHGHAQFRNMTSSELGPKLTQFCDGAPAHWLDVTPGTDIVKRKADADGVTIKIEHTVTFIHTLACILIRVDTEITITVTKD